MTKTPNGTFTLARSEWFKLLLLVGCAVTVAAGGIMYRVGQLEAAVEHMGAMQHEMKQDIRELRGRH